jgi:DNA mismatch repair ATPase MutS
MLQLGMMVPAASAALSPVSGIFTHFPEEADDTIDKGRLGEECARLREIFNALDGYGMVLLDESLSSTGAYEATYIAEEILSALAVKGVRGIFSTHLHDLALATSRINERSLALGGGAVDTLVAGMEQGKRSFKILRAKPDGKSYARDIANKYGLSFESLMEGAEK